MTKLFEKQWEEGSRSLPSWVYLPPSILLSCTGLPAAPHIGPALSNIKLPKQEVDLLAYSGTVLKPGFRRYVPKKLA